jgi:hypothetical protein
MLVIEWSKDGEYVSDAMLVIEWSKNGEYASNGMVEKWGV